MEIGSDFCVWVPYVESYDSEVKLSLTLSWASVTSMLPE